MGSLFGGRSVVGYNANPPPDDGTTGSNNQLTWNRDIKGKVGDPLNTFATNISADLVTALGKTLSGGSVISTAITYTAGPADQGRIIVATASGITVNTPDATVVLAPFVWAINNQSTGNITIAGHGAQNVDGANTLTLKAARGVILWTDGSNWFSSGAGMGNIPTSNPPFGFDAAINLQLNATVASNLLTVAVKANDGTDPTSSNPVMIAFRDTTGSNGDPVWVAVTAALSISTNAVGASLGTANSVPFRIWVVAFNNAGTVVLALWQSVTGGASPTAIASLYESLTQSTTAISAAATSAGTFYTPNGTTLTSKAFRILGYLDYNAGLATAGTYASAPNVVQLFGPGIKKPCDVVQVQYFLVSGGGGSTSSSSTATSTSTTQSISPSSPCNLIKANATGPMQVSSPNATLGTAQIYRGSTAIGTVSNMQVTGQTLTAMNAGTSMSALDAPGTTSSTTYVVKITSSDNTHNVQFGGSSDITLMELMT